MSEKIVIDLSKYMSEVGKTLPFQAEFEPKDELLPYPNATITKSTVDFSVTFLNPEVHVCGDITCFVSGQCDKCLAPVNKAITIPFDQIFYKDCSDDPDAFVYQNGKADITQAVEEEIALGVPTSLLCNDDCKGLCPKCGADRNKVQCDCDTTKENPFSFLKNLKF